MEWLQGKSYSTPLEGKIPEFRVSEDVSAFQNIGVDYFGHLFIKCYADKTKDMKAWVLLITYAVSRVVHFEIVSVEVREFLFSFQRFVGRRGTASFVRSDNAETFANAKTNGSKQA